MTDKEFKLEIESIKKGIRELETGEQIIERLEKMENKLWWIQGILGSTGIAMTIMVVRLLTLLK